jgi:hypothetical protein
MSDGTMMAYYGRRVSRKLYKTISHRDTNCGLYKRWGEHKNC